MNTGARAEPAEPSGDHAAHALAALGVPADDEFLYRTLLTRPGSTVAELAAATGWDAARVRRRTRSLETRGMLTRVPSRPVRFAPAPPDVVTEVLALQRQEEIERARLAAASLTEEFRCGQRIGSGLPVQVLSGRDAIAQRFFQTQQSTREEVLILDRPPYVAQPAEQQTSVQRRLMRRGVRYRTIYARQSFDSPEQLGLCRELALLGEDSRVLDEVPLKLVIADRRVALVPFALPTEREVMVLQSSALLDALVVFFEMLWQRAVPMWPTATRPDSGRPDSGRPDGEQALSGEDEQLLALSAAGLTDRAIARRLGVAQRTVERRMRRIMNLLGARTRFQAGLQAAHQGLIGGATTPSRSVRTRS
ncbi:helix-turn-helix domain-containing protein [Streptomyces sp. NPDC000410]|uniref:helix-turn-helix domain-containing protein n=1 Tax=Streptomyces sp. NPDC000410 TaxID=3154254 RepID=UPI003328B881